MDSTWRSREILCGHGSDFPCGKILVRALCILLHSPVLRTWEMRGGCPPHLPGSLVSASRKTLALETCGGDSPGNACRALCFRHALLPATRPIPFRRELSERLPRGVIKHRWTRCRPGRALAAPERCGGFLGKALYADAAWAACGDDAFAERFGVPGFLNESRGGVGPPASAPKFVPPLVTWHGTCVDPLG